MFDAYFTLKWVHILSSTVLFGTGLGTAFHLWFAHLRGDARTVAVVAANVVLADWLFTTTSGIVQPVTGVLLALEAGHDLTAAWLVLTYVLYVLAAVCWFPVVRLQIGIRDIARDCAERNVALTPDYHRRMRAWFLLGWPAFLALVAVFYLMVAKPELW
ncbi:MAG: DUF2269 family protein [Hyphomicrobiales bacterium]